MAKKGNQRVCRSSLPINKIVDHNTLTQRVAELIAQNKTVVFTNGVFDLLHAGHVRYLQEARALGDILVIAVNSDSSVKRIKGDLRPIVPEDERAELLAALECVDLITLFDTPTPVPLIERVRPSVYVKGGDYKIEDLPEYPVVSAYGGMVKILSLISGKSSTNIIAKICKAYPNGAEGDAK